MAPDPRLATPRPPLYAWSKRIDRALAVLKWPVAALVLLSTPALVLALRDLVRRTVQAPRPLYPFLTGVAAYLVGWVLVFRRRAFGSFFTTLEHELTHAIFAWATLHRVVAFRATWRSGGHIQFIGRGSWLISIAPYFFPTLSVITLLVLSFLPSAYLFWGSAALGATVAYHATSTWLEIHRHQRDLQEVGFPFAWCFLPGANALVMGMLLSFASGGMRALLLYFRAVETHAAGLARALLGA
jgi:hypothetical protein